MMQAVPAFVLDGSEITSNVPASKAENHRFGGFLKNWFDRVGRSGGRRSLPHSRLAVPSQHRVHSAWFGLRIWLDGRSSRPRLG